MDVRAVAGLVAMSEMGIDTTGKAYAPIEATLEWGGA
jgi:hypothetical protein